jgi:hypothetical protein
MEEKKRIRKSPSPMEDPNPIMNNTSSEEEFTDERINQIVWGWDSVDKAAAEVFASVHRTLLEGVPVFLYKNTTTKSDLCQVVVVRNIDEQTGKLSDDYGMGMITAGFSVLYPHLPIEYLESDLLSDLEKYKVDKKIINTYVSIINALKK